MKLKISILGIGTYMGDPDDYTDFLMYDAIKTSVLSGGINHIDTAPNYRYKKSENTVGRILATLDNKYGITRDQLFLTTKGGYIAEDAEKQISRSDEIRRMVSQLKVPEDEIVKESAHSLNPVFLKD
jgi:aryl-alcohol dehydrogenase-like predicted oxidoreductase